MIQALLSEARKPLLYLALVMVPVLTADFFLRVFVPRDPALRKVEAVEQRSAAPPISAADVQADFDRWMPKPVEVKPENLPRTLRLQGIFTARGIEKASILLESPSGLPPERVTAVKGQVVDGWTVADISRHRVRMTRDGETQELIMFRRASQ
ncbi:MAG: hypothetical protein FJ160_02770 [Gammaproteobacteria bacterium]|nr:hypothetical protein [Gammaproteobacteria bacterium]